MSCCVFSILIFPLWKWYYFRAMKKIAVIGSTNTDMVITGKRIPVPGETVSDGHFMMNPGGKGANQAVAVARLSAKKGACLFVAKVGDDVFGRDTAARLKKDGIAARLIVDKKEPSGTALILVDAKGQNVISVALGANGTLSPADVAPYAKEIADAAALLMQLETPIETVTWAAKTAHDAGVPVILNPAPARKLPKALYPLERREGGRRPEEARRQARAHHDGREGLLLRRLREGVPGEEGEGCRLRCRRRHLQRRIRRGACGRASRLGGGRLRAEGVRDLRHAPRRTGFRAVQARGCLG